MQVRHSMNFDTEITMNVSPEAKREWKKLDYVSPVIGVQYMLHKGLKYIPTIIMMACDAEVGSYGDTKMEVSREHEELVLKLFLELEGKVNVRMEKIIGDGTEGAVWPCEILDMKEVRDEAMLLATSDEILLSTDNPDDRQTVVREIEAEKGVLTEENIKKRMEIVNNYLRKWGNFFLKAMEIHRKYPDVRFRFRVTEGE
ncbi:MAG: hypothetical protein ACPL4E_09490 [Thermoproteota archaeon]